MFLAQTYAWSEWEIRNKKEGGFKVSKKWKNSSWKMRINLFMGNVKFFLSLVTQNLFYLDFFSPSLWKSNKAAIPGTNNVREVRGKLKIMSRQRYLRKIEILFTDVRLRNNTRTKNVNGRWEEKGSEKTKDGFF